MLFNKDNLSIYIFFIVVLDILIFPYFPYFAISNMFFLIFVDIILQKKILIELRNYYLFILFLIISLLSTWLSYYSDPYNLGIFSENIKRFFQIILFFIFYFYFYNFFSYKDNGKYIKYIIPIFFISVSFWCLLYYLSFDNFLSLKRLFNPNDNFIDRFVGGENPFYRFSYIWSDPNNIAYAILGVFIFTLFNYKNNLVTIFMYFIVVLMVCLLSMSTTAWLILFLIVVPCLLYRVDLKNPKNLISLFFLIVIFFLLFNRALVDLMSSEVALNSLDRFENNNINTDSGNSRFEIWQKIYNYYNGSFHQYLILGDGYQLHYQDKLLKPHNGLFLIFFAYGFFGLIIFLHIFFQFKFSRKYLFIIPFFLCFFINVMIGELKMFVLYILLLAYVRSN